MSDASSSASSPITKTTADIDSLSWRIHPFKRKMRTSALMVAILLAVPIFTAWYVGSLALGLFFSVVMFASMHRFFLPTDYTIDATGIQISTLTSTQLRAWSQFRTAYPDRNGVLISPFAGPSRLENFRGVYLIFEQNRETVIALITHYLSSSGADSTAKDQQAASTETTS